MQRIVIILAIPVVLLSCKEDMTPNRIDSECKVASEGIYPAQESSDYVLPWIVGESFVVSQGNCTTGSHSVQYKEQYSYDFAMPVGTNIHAARKGIVIGIEEAFVDGNKKVGQHNFVFIEHEDGSVARYIHMTKDGVLVSLNDTIDQGALIALSGNTGYSTGPRLHFDVVDGSCANLNAQCQSQPLTFSNTVPHPEGLEENKEYTALPY